MSTDPQQVAAIREIGATIHDCALARTAAIQPQQASAN
jgi:hypothetical protein